jgi:uncharacterized protein (TIGR00661 family)
LIKGKNINSPGRKLRVLVAPLDWGLGHSTRCIPIINKLLNQDCEVFIAAEGACRFLLQNEFKTAVFLNIKGYRVNYSKNKSLMPLKLLVQLPKILYRIYRENSWLKQIIKEHAIDAVISDNRLGLYNKTIPCVYITHQLKIKTGFRFTEWLAQKVHYYFINKFSECWVPDTIEKNNLAGELSHPGNLPKIPVKYIGPLSRFEKMPVNIKYDIVVLISGPEPQRTVFEKIILKELKNYYGKLLLVRGLPADNFLISSEIASLEIKNHLPANELNLAIQQADLIISRCGYTTIMDLVKLQKKAILVPTPGQTEQEYLADYLMKQKLFLCVKQDQVLLPAILKEAEGFSFQKLLFPQNEYEKAVESFIKKTT